MSLHNFKSSFSFQITNLIHQEETIKKICNNSGLKRSCYNKFWGCYNKIPWCNLQIICYENYYSFIVKVNLPFVLPLRQAIFA